MMSHGVHNVSPIREGGCTAPFRVSDTRCGTYLIYYSEH